MRGQTGLPLWAAGVLAGLFVPVVVPFELVFGDGVGALAAGGGVVIGLLIAGAAVTVFVKSRSTKRALNA